MSITMNDGNGKRLLGMFNFSGNFEVQKQGPLDTRMVVTSITELLATQQSDGSPTFQYWGMLVVVSGDPDVENDGLYRLLEGGDPTLITGWEKISGSGSGGIDSYITGGTITDSILTLGYSDDKDPITINFEECCGGGLSEVYISAFEIPTVKEVGGIKKNTPVQNLTGKTFSEIFDLMFFPTQTPSGSNSKPSYDNGVDDVFEIGDTIEITHTTTADRGGWSPSTYAGGVVQPSTFRGPVTNAFLTYNGGGSSTQDGVELYNSTDGITIDNPTETYTVVEGDQGWVLSVTYSDGDDPFDSTGEVILDAGGAAVTESSSEDSLHGSYPVYISNKHGVMVPELPVQKISNTVVAYLGYDGTESGPFDGYTATFEIHIPKIFGQTISTIVQKDPFGNWGTTNQKGVNWNETASFTRSTTYHNGVPYHKMVFKNETGRQGKSYFKITLS